MRAFLAAAVLAVVSAPSAAWGAVPTGGRTELTSEAGEDVSIPSSARWREKESAPLSASGVAALLALESEAGGEAWVSYCDATGVPSRIVVPGLLVTGAMANDDIAEQHARGFLAKYVDLLAPGSAASDFVLAANDLDAGLRTVTFFQTRRGRRVRFGQVSFRYRADRLFLIGSEALPFDDRINDPGDPPDGATALLPIYTHGALTFRWVVAGAASHAGSRSTPASDLETFFDATTGEPVASLERLRFSTATLLLHVPERAPAYGPRIDAPAPLAELVVDGVGGVSGANGSFSFAGTTSMVSASSSGPGVAVTFAGMPGAGTMFTVADGASYVWDASADELADAQLSTFIHAGEARAYAKSFAPNLAFLNDQVHAIVNAEGTCNSYSDGTFIHFYKGGAGCENTGRIADIVYHEYEHSIHAHALIPGAGVYDGALSEGVADYLAASITGDPGVGRGLYFTSAPVRDLEPLIKHRWPDDLVGEIHLDGRIIGETLWDLRSALMAKLGAAAGRARADVLYYEGVRRAADIPSMYPEVLAADDDDGNLANGTPNICEINRAFGQHGLRGLDASATVPALEPASVTGFNVSARVNGLYGGCPDDAITGATLRSRVRGDAGPASSAPMTVSGAIFDGHLAASSAGTSLDFQVEVALAGGTLLSLPDNAADPWYEMYVGAVEPIYCTDFESDPARDGWTHGLSDATAGDDWEWGAPNGTVFNGDPSAAFSGAHVFGTDLGNIAGHDGKYLSGKTTWAESPTVDTTGFDTVRLQYRRWLSVVDARFDQASILANGELVWQNAASPVGGPSELDHRDREWRFHDVDLTSHVKDHRVSVRFELASHALRQLGGWTLDDFCIVGVRPPPAPPPPSEPVSLAGGAACGVTTQPKGTLGWLASAALSVFAVRRRARRMAKAGRRRVESVRELGSRFED